jgi:hypothetical protein
MAAERPGKNGVILVKSKRLALQNARSLDYVRLRLTPLEMTGLGNSR